MTRSMMISIGALAHGNIHFDSNQLVCVAQ